MLSSVCSAQMMGRRILGTLRRTKKLHLHLLVGSPPWCRGEEVRGGVAPSDTDASAAQRSCVSRAGWHPWRQRVAFRTRMFNLRTACCTQPLHSHVSFPALPSNHQAPDAHSCHVCVRMRLQSFEVFAGCSGCPGPILSPLLLSYSIILSTDSFFRLFTSSQAAFSRLANIRSSVCPRALRAEELCFSSVRSVCESGATLIIYVAWRPRPRPHPPPSRTCNAQ